MKETHGHRCASCGKPETEGFLTIDHIVPLARGGTHEAANIQPLCLPCNMRKHARAINYTEGYEITDLAALPREFLRVSDLKIMAVVRAMGASCRIPGIRTFTRTITSARSR
jgi:hypothetical protein